MMMIFGLEYRYSSRQKASYLQKHSIILISTGLFLE
jgi:hypothetical protein